MKKPIRFTIDKGQTYQTRSDLAKGEIPLNTGLMTSLLITLKEGDQTYELDIITTDMDGSRPVVHTVTMSTITMPVPVKKYKNLSFHLREGYSDTAYTFEAEFV